MPAETSSVLTADTPATPAKPAPSGSRKIVSWLVGFFVVLLVVEAGVRVASTRLPEPLRYYSTDAQRIVDDMDVLRRAGVKSDLTFVGTSMVRRDIDADEMESKLPGIKWAHNVALPGAQTPIVERWMLDEVIPRIHPKRVVWGISSLDFNDGRPDHPIDQYDSARQTQPGTYADLDRLMGHVAVSEYREALRNPLTLERTGDGQCHVVRRPPPPARTPCGGSGIRKPSAKQIAAGPSEPSSDGSRQTTRQLPHRTHGARVVYADPDADEGKEHRDRRRDHAGAVRVSHRTPAWRDRLRGVEGQGHRGREGHRCSGDRHVSDDAGRRLP